MNTKLAGGDAGVTETIFISLTLGWFFGPQIIATAGTWHGGIFKKSHYNDGSVRIRLGPFSIGIYH